MDRHPFLPGLGQGNGHGFRGGMIEFGGRHGGGDHRWFAWLIFVLLVALLVVGVLALLRSRQPTQVATVPAPDSPLSVLDHRYAAGEIERTDYLQARQDLLGQTSP